MALGMGTSQTIAASVATEATGRDQDSSNRDALQCEWLSGGCCSSDAGEQVVGDLTWFRVGLALAFAGQGMVFGLGYNLALEAGEVPGMSSPVYWALHGALLFSAVAVIALLGFPLVRSTVRSVKAREWTVEPLFLLTASGAMAASLLSSLLGTGSVYYEVVGLVLVIYTVGRKVGAATRSKALALTRQWQEGLSWVNVETPLGNRQRVAYHQIVPESVVVVLPEEVVTVDGRILEGRASVRETVATGELLPVVKAQGDFIYAGSHVVDAPLKIAPSLSGEGRLIDQILRTVDQAAAKPSRFQSEADRLMRWFLPGVLMASVLTFLGWFSTGVAWPQALFNAMAVLLVACPCALGLATPIAVWNGLLALSKRGLVSRDGRLLDGLVECDFWIFDKTGTLTEVPEAEVSLTPVSHTYSEDWLRTVVASIEAHSKHPLAVTLQSLSETRLPVEQFQTEAGKGVRGIVLGHTVRIGHAQWLGLETESKPGRSVFLEVDQQYVARITLGEQLLPGTEGVLKALQGRGVQMRILSGDPAPGFEAIAGVSVEGGLMPHQKMSIVRDLKSQGHRVLFVGDGLNDAGAMAEASLSIALNKGASLTQAAAAATLLGERLETLLWAHSFCRALKRRLRGNLVFALSYNVLGITLAASGYLHPVVAAVLMLLSSLVVSWRAAHLVEGVSSSRKHAR